MRQHGTRVGGVPFIAGCGVRWDVAVPCTGRRGAVHMASTPFAASHNKRGARVLCCGCVNRVCEPRMDGATHERGNATRYVHGAAIGPRGRLFVAHSALCTHAARVAVHCVDVAVHTGAVLRDPARSTILDAMRQDVHAAAEAVDARRNALNMNALLSALQGARAVLSRCADDSAALGVAHAAVRAAHRTCAALHTPTILDTPGGLDMCVYVYTLPPECVVVAQSGLEDAATAFVDGCGVDAVHAFRVAVVAAWMQDPACPRKVPASADSYALRMRAQAYLDARARRGGKGGVLPVSVARTRATLSVLHALGLRCTECAFMRDTADAARRAVVQWRAVHHGAPLDAQPVQAATRRCAGWVQ